MAWRKLNPNDLLLFTLLLLQHMHMRMPTLCEAILRQSVIANRWPCQLIFYLQVYVLQLYRISIFFIAVVAVVTTLHMWAFFLHDWPYWILHKNPLLSSMAGGQKKDSHNKHKVSGFSDSIQSGKVVKLIVIAIMNNLDNDDDWSNTEYYYLA